MNKYFDKKIIGYSSNFDELDKEVKNQSEASNYYAWIRDGYKKYFDSVDSTSESKFYIRYYRAKKLINSSQKLISASSVTVTPFRRLQEALK